MEKKFYGYILASKKNGTLYIGVTSDLPKRIWEHKEGIFEGLRRNTMLTRWFITKCLTMRKMRSTAKNA